MAVKIWPIARDGRFIYYLLLFTAFAYLLGQRGLQVIVIFLLSIHLLIFLQFLTYLLLQQCQKIVKNANHNFPKCLVFVTNNLKPNNIKYKII